MGAHTGRKNAAAAEPEAAKTKHAYTSSKEGAERTPANTGIAAPPVFNVGDHAVGETQFFEIFASNIESRESWVTVRYSGDPSIVLVAAPQRYRPSVEGFDPNTAIKLAFTPTSKGHHRGMIEITGTWPGGRSTITEISIEAAAHEVGQRDVGDEEAVEREALQANARAAKEKAAVEQADRAAEVRLDRNDLPGSAGNRERLKDATNDAATAFGNLLHMRQIGVQSAEGEASRYHHHQPAFHEDLVLTLAFAALDVVTAGLAGALTKTLELALARKVETAAHVDWWSGRAVGEKTSHPNEAVVALFTGAVEEVPRQGVAGFKGKVSERGADHIRNATTEDVDGTSTDPFTAFFQAEKTALVGQNADKAKGIADHARRTLEPMLTTDPKLAISYMRGIADQISAMVKTDKTANEQATQSAIHWTRYVAGSKMGTVDEKTAKRTGLQVARDGTETAVIQSANVSPGVNGEIMRRDGLIDIEFRADTEDVSRVSVVGVRLDGVSISTRERVVRNILGSGLPIRAYSFVGGVQLEIIRDEAGNVAFTDGTGTIGMPGNWFHRRSGKVHAGPDATLRAAGLVLEQLVEQVAANAHVLSGDSDA